MAVESFGDVYIVIRITHTEIRTRSNFGIHRLNIQYILKLYGTLYDSNNIKNSSSAVLEPVPFNS